MSKQRVLLKTAQAAEVLGRTARCLQHWREKQFGPPWYEIGGAFVYDKAELEAWLAAQRREGRAA